MEIIFEGSVGFLSKMIFSFEFFQSVHSIILKVNISAGVCFKTFVRRSPAMWLVVQAAVQEIHEAGVIERSASEWCHAPVIQKKSDGKHRFCRLSKLKCEK